MSIKISKEIGKVTQKGNLSEHFMNLKVLKDLRPVQIVGDQTDAKKFSKHFFIAKNGTMVQKKSKKMTLLVPHWNHKCETFKIDMCIDGLHRCQTVKNILRNTWGDDTANEFKMFEDTVKNSLDSEGNAII